MTSALFTTAVAIGNAIGASNKREIVDNLPISFDVEVKKDKHNNSVKYIFW